MLFTKKVGVSNLGLIFKQADDKSFSLAVYRDPYPHDHLFIDGALLNPVWEGRVLAISHPVTVSIDTLRSRSDWQDYSCFPIPVDVFKLEFQPSFNVIAETVASKVKITDNAYRKVESYVALLFPQTRQSASLAECNLTLYEDARDTLPLITDVWPNFDETNRTWSVEKVTAPPITVIAPDEYSGYVQDRTYPRFTVTPPASIAPEGYGTFQVQAHDIDGNALPVSDFELLLEVTAGYLPQKRCVLQSGAGSFKVGALGLEPGDSIRVKLGTRVYSGITDATVTVAAAAP